MRRHRRRRHDAGERPRAGPPGRDRRRRDRGGPRRRRRRAHPRARPGDRAAARAIPRCTARSSSACARRTSTSCSTSPRAWAATSSSAGPTRRCPRTPTGTDMVGAAERLAHVEELRPEICTLDCGTMNFAAGGDYVMVNSPEMLRAMARRIRELGVRPELEVFDTGHLVMVADLVREGLIDDPPLIQLCMGIPYGAPNDPATLLALVGPAAARAPCSRRSRSAACSCRTSRSPRSSAATSASGSRTTSTSSRGTLATNAQLVERAVTILEAMNVAGPRPGRGARQAAARGAWLTGRGPSALLGGGVIGGGWAARFVLNGVDVRLYDPAPDAERAVGEVLDNARRAMRRLTLAPLPPEGDADARGDARGGRRRRRLRAGERARARGAQARAARGGEPRRAGRTSCSRARRPACCPSRLQADMAHPERLTVGHPFNPVYLLPLVEVCGGERTAPETRRARRRGVPRRSGCARSCCAARSTRSSPTGSSRRCGARRCGSSPTTSRRSRTSTTRSATARGCGGRAWARS